MTEKLTDHPLDPSFLDDGARPVNGARRGATEEHLHRRKHTRRRRCGCSPPTELAKRAVRDGGRVDIEYPPGSMGGELRVFVDQAVEEDPHWIECARMGGGACGQERPLPLESFLNAIHTAAYLGVKLSTLYAWAPFLESADKRGSRLIFWTQILVNDDIPELENRIPHRADLTSERLDRALSGEVLRRGRHAQGCLKTHSEGRCTRPPNPESPRRRSQRWLHDLGKDSKKKK
jgi:hypothetical protein